MGEIDNKKIIDNITDWIREAVTTANFDKVLVAVSGGVDSAVCTALLTRALKKENIYVVLMPYGRLHPEGVKDAELLIKSIGIKKENIIKIDIKKTVDTIAKEAHIGKENIRLGNIMARVRMVYLFDLSKKLGALVCGTENRTEHYLGYFTRFGDEASDLEPIRSFFKTQVWELAKYLEIPSKIISKAPTAGLWKNQTDEKELGFTYREADKVLKYYFDEKLTSEDIVKKGIPSDIVIKVLERVIKNDFKHQLPLVYV